MSTVMVFFYPTRDAAQDAQNNLQHLQKFGSVQLEDMALVTKSPAGNVKIHQMHNLPLVGATGGAVLGTIIGMIFLLPYLGVLVGAAAGAIGGYVADYGIDDDFMKKTADELRPGSAGLFLLVRDTPIEEIIHELAAFGGSLAHTSLTAEQEHRLKLLFDEDATAKIRKHLYRGDVPPEMHF